MITREELLQSPEYWFENAQNDLYGQVMEYMKKEGFNQSQLAEKLGVSKGYISQVLKGEFNYTLKKLIELSLAIGKVPQIEYKPLVDALVDDERTRYLSAGGIEVTVPAGSSMIPVSLEQNPATVTQAQFQWPLKQA